MKIIVDQEVLSGIKAQTQFERLRQILGAFPGLPIERSDYERTALFFTACRRRGIQGSNTDFLICAVAHRYSLPIFTQLTFHTLWSIRKEISFSDITEG